MFKPKAASSEWGVVYVVCNNEICFNVLLNSSRKLHTHPLLIQNRKHIQSCRCFAIPIDIKHISMWTYAEIFINFALHVFTYSVSHIYILTLYNKVWQQICNFMCVTTLLYGIINEYEKQCFSVPHFVSERSDLSQSVNLLATRDCVLPVKHFLNQTRPHQMNKLCINEKQSQYSPLSDRI